MQLLQFLEVVNGWWLGIQFNEKIREGRNFIPIQQAVFFPKIDDERSMKRFDNNHPGTVHNFGEMTVKGFVKFIPRIEKGKLEDSYGWSRFTENSDGSYDSRRIQSESLEIFHGNGEFEKKYPKSYVKTKFGWLPNVYQIRVNPETGEVTRVNLVLEAYREVEKAVKKIELEQQFNKEFREGLASGNSHEVLKKWTVKTVEKFGTEEKIEQKPEDKYRAIEIPAMPGYDESCGRTYRSTQGLFQYSLISENKPSPSKWQDKANEEYYVKTLKRASVAR